MLLFIFCGEDPPEENTLEATIETTEEIEMTYDKTYSEPPAMNINESGNYSAVIVTSLGSIEIELFTDIAPITVNNFVNLSKDGYYDNVIFHRVIKGFMIQGGDPSGTGHGEMGKYPGYEFQDELNNPMQYEKGIVAMANRGPNTTGSQFFIMHVDYPLPYDYTIFGKVSNGIDVIDAIANVQTGDMDKPVDDVFIKSVDIKEN